MWVIFIGLLGKFIERLLMGILMVILDLLKWSWQIWERVQHWIIKKRFFE